MLIILRDARKGQCLLNFSAILRLDLTLGLFLPCSKRLVTISVVDIIVTNAVVVVTFLVTRKCNNQQ